MEQLQKKSLVLRDRLAVDRTHMANERTLLAYLRTAIMIGASGITLVKIYPQSQFWRTFGLALIPIAIVLSVISFIRFFKLRCKITRNCSEET